MKTITHDNLWCWLDKLATAPGLQIGDKHRTWHEWYDAPCTLEFPLGELARDGLCTLALLGYERPEPQPLTGKEGFSAQGLESKVQIRKPLLNALFNMRDILPQNRGRILL